MLFIVAGQGNDDNLYVVVHIFGEERAQWPVDEAAGENALRGGASLAPEEGPWDAATRIEAFFEIDGEWEKVDALTWRVGHCRCRQ